MTVSRSRQSSRSDPGKQALEENDAPDMNVLGTQNIGTSVALTRKGRLRPSSASAHSLIWLQTGHRPTNWPLLRNFLTLIFLSRGRRRRAVWARPGLAHHL